MRIEPLGRGRAILHDQISTFEIIIPARKNWFVMIFICFWLCGWAFGFVFGWGMTVGALLGSPFSLFTLVWSVGWTMGGVFALRTVVWMMAGKEVITIGQGELSLKRRGDFLSRRRVYELSAVRNMRVRADDSDFMRQRGLPGSGKAGVIRFDYGMKTLRFADDIDEAEGRAILERLRERHFLSERHFV